MKETQSSDKKENSESAAAWQSYFRDAWGQVLVSVHSPEEALNKAFPKMATWTSSNTTEVIEKLKVQRQQLETAFLQSVSRALVPFRVPTKNDLDRLHIRIDHLSERIEALQNAAETDEK